MTMEQIKEMNGGMPFVRDLSLTMRPGPLGVVRGLREVVTCIYGPTVTYAFPDPLITAYRESSMVYVSLISVLDGTAQNWCKQEHLRTQMSDTVLFGRVKDLELIVLNFRGQLQCWMGGKRERPIKAYPKFWILNPLEKHTREILIIGTWTEAFDLMRKELEMILEKEVLTAIIPELPTVRRMTLGMNNPMLVPSAQATEVVKRQQRAFTQGWDPLFIAYFAAAYFHKIEYKINSWTTQTKKMRGTMPPRIDAREVGRVLERTAFEKRTQCMTTAE